MGRLYKFQNTHWLAIPRIAAGAAVLAFAALAWTPNAPAQVNEIFSDPDEGAVRAGPVQPAEDPARPRRHFRVRDAVSLDANEAERIYGAHKSDMAQRYRLSKHVAAAKYQKWKRYNVAPYQSTSHGNRYLNNYANETAAAYGRFEKAGRFPVGSVIAKDSFTVSRSGKVAPGPLFLMEKMSGGFNYVSGNWRYTMIMPDGSLFGTTKGEGAERVEFCISCHLAVEKQDHLFFIPGKYRRK